MKYPIIKGKHLSFRKGGNCAHCRKKNNGEFVTLNGGAMKRDGNCAVTIMQDDILTFLKFCDHGVTKSGHHLEICDNEGFAQFEFYFCSIKCLRSFLNKLVDDFEKL